RLPDADLRCRSRVARGRAGERTQAAPHDARPSRHLHLHAGIQRLAAAAAEEFARLGLAREGSDRRSVQGAFLRARLDLERPPRRLPRADRAAPDARTRARRAGAARAGGGERGGGRLRRERRGGGRPPRGASARGAQAPHRLCGIRAMKPRSIPPRERLIVALDLPDASAAETMVARLGDAVSFYKIGFELVLAGGLPLAGALV